mmetsp:Transcript_93712/g.180263  ORF Transcript_93712/g.180263 Transcript_93712/m.180263 type:complete len:422 (-) Transcript_93712:44-1309(-)
MGKPTPLDALLTRQTKNGRIEQILWIDVFKDLHPDHFKEQSAAEMEESVRAILQLYLDVDVSKLGSLFGPAWRKVKKYSAYAKFGDWLNSLPGVERSGNFVRLVGQDRDRAPWEPLPQPPPSVVPPPIPGLNYPYLRRKGLNVTHIFNLSRTHQGVDLFAEFVGEAGGRLSGPAGLQQRPVATPPRNDSKLPPSGWLGKKHKLASMHERRRSRSRRVKGRSPDKESRCSVSASSRSCSSRSRSSSSEDDSASGEHFVHNVLDKVRAKLRDTTGANRHDHHQSHLSRSNSESRSSQHIAAKGKPLPSGTLDETPAPTAMRDGHQDVSSKVSTASCSQVAASEDNAELKKWLCGLDSGQGRFLQYLQPLQREFGDLQQLAAAVNPETTVRSVTQAVDPMVFEVLGVKSLGHKMVLSRAICALS